MIKFSLALPEKWFVYNTVKLVFSGGREAQGEGGFVIRNEILANVGLPITLSLTALEGPIGPGR